MPSDIAHQGGVVRGDLGRRADISMRLVEVEVADAEIRQIAEHLQGDSESL